MIFKIVFLGKRRITPMFIPPSDEPSELEKEAPKTIPSEPKPLSSSSSFISTSTNEQFASINEGKLDARIKKVTAPCKMLNPETKYNLNAITNKVKIDDRQVQVVRAEAGNAKPLKGPIIKAVGSLRVQVLNDSASTPIGSLTKITCNTIIVPGNPKRNWEIFIDSPIVCFSCCTKYVLTCSIDFSIRFLDAACGTLLLPVLCLSSPVTLCAISTNMQVAGVLTKLCELRIWNVNQKKIILSLNCADIFTRGNATSLFIDDSGIPFITLADGSSFSYSRDLDTWLKLSSADLMSKTLLSKHISRNFVRNMKACPLTSVQSFGKGAKSNTFEMIAETWPHTMELLFLENQIKLCETLESIDEMKYWYAALGAKLATHGTEPHIRKLLDDLLNGYMCGYGGADAKCENEKIFLEILLNKLKLKPKWQRLYMEYTEQLI